MSISMVLLFICNFSIFIQELPTSIGKLKNLTNFNVDRNRLPELPREVS